MVTSGRPVTAAAGCSSPVGLGRERKSLSAQCFVLVRQKASVEPGPIHGRVSAPLGNETWDPLAIEKGFGNVEGLPTGAEAASHAGYRHVLHAMAAQHIVHDLRDVLAVEDPSAHKGRVFDEFRVGMERTGSTKHGFLELGWT